MQRDIIAKLNAWKASEYRKPLILKGRARLERRGRLRSSAEPRTSILCI